MTPTAFAEKYGLSVVSPGAGDCRDIEGVYCGDLLSLVMGRAREDDCIFKVRERMQHMTGAPDADDYLPAPFRRPREGSGADAVSSRR